MLPKDSHLEEKAEVKKNRCMGMGNIPIQTFCDWYSKQFN